MDEPVTIRAFYNMAWGAVELQIYQNIPNTTVKRAFATNIRFEVKERGTLVQPVCRLQDHEAQMLMNDLWNAGIRPKEHRFSDLSFETQKRHLDDMRAIVACQLSVRLP